MRHLIDIIESARFNFVSADWRHEYKGEADVAYCEGDVDGCLYCAQVLEAAEEADQEAESAVAALMSGDIVAAYHHLEVARKIEVSWGDAPAYGPALRALQAAV